MKILIASKKELNDPKWKSLDTNDLHPLEIKKLILSLVNQEEDSEMYFHTLNITILNMIKGEDRDDCVISYKDTYIMSGGEVIPILDEYSEDYLVHFQLGDLFDRGYLTDISYLKKKGDA